MDAWGRPLLDDETPVEAFSDAYADSPFATLYRDELEVGFFS